MRNIPPIPRLESPRWRSTNCGLLSSLDPAHNSYRGVWVLDESSFIHSFIQYMPNSTFYVAPGTVPRAGVPRDHKVDGIPVPVRSGQQSEAVNNTVSEGPQRT